jgi:serine/threonine-protein kinase
MRPAVGVFSGTLIENYKVVSLLGEGGMGEVYLAEDASLGRRVALKLLPEPFSADPSRVRRFTDEARAASALNHPNILTVYHVGEFEGRRYIATELVDGETLRQRLARGPLPIAEALDIALQAAGALQAAHDAGIIHRDIKPENIMIRRDGYVKLLDFGLAKLTSQSAVLGHSRTLTRVGDAIGTLDYMAPEQAMGAAVDARADIYSLSVVLYEMLTGTLPRELASGSGDRSASGEVIPLALLQTLRRGLSSDPAARPASAVDFARELEASRSVVRAAPARRRWKVAAAVAILAIAAGAIWMRMHPASSGVKSMAILPLTTTGPEADQAYLTVGLADALITRLGELQQIQVTPTATIRHFVNTTRGPADVGRELGVDAVLTGSVQRAGDRLRVTLQLTRVSDGMQMWAGRFDEQYTSIFAVQDAITQQVTSNLLLDIGHLAPHPRRQTTDSEAYELYLRGREQWARRTPSSIRSAIEMFTKASEIDPSFALAYAGIADAYALTASGLAPADRFPKAKAAARKALALDEGLADAHNALAFITYKWEWNWADSQREFRRALEIDPSHVLARQWFGEFLSIQGFHDEALQQFVKARQLDPYSTPIRVDQAAAFVRAGRAQDAVTVLQDGLKQEPNSAAMYNGLYSALWTLGRDREAFDALAHSRLLSGANDAAIDEMRAAFKKGGFVELARYDVVRLVEADRAGKPPAAYFSRLALAGTIARQYAVIGDRDQALSWLEEAARRRDDGPLAIRTATYWVPFRNEPRFQAVERLVGMPR